MKNLRNLKILLLTGILAMGFFFTDCKRDKEDPVISLKGNSYMKLALQDEYVEPGFTAEDDIDGNITSRVTVSDSIIPDTVGIYKITYTVKDGKDKETSVYREVERYNKAVIFEGYYLGKFIYPAPGTVPVDYIDTIRASETINYQFTISNFAGEIGSNVIALIEPLSVHSSLGEIKIADQGSFTFSFNGDSVSTVLSNNPPRLNIYYKLDNVAGQLVLNKQSDID